MVNNSNFAYRLHCVWIYRRSHRHNVDCDAVSHSAGPLLGSGAAPGAAAGVDRHPSALVGRWRLALRRAIRLRPRLRLRIRPLCPRGIPHQLQLRLPHRGTTTTIFYLSILLRGVGRTILHHLLLLSKHFPRCRLQQKYFHY